MRPHPTSFGPLHDRPGARSSVGTYLNLLVACAVAGSAAVSAALVALERGRAARTPPRGPSDAGSNETSPAATHQEHSR
jgi:hypothetical protein